MPDFLANQLLLKIILDCLRDSFVLLSNLMQFFLGQKCFSFNLFPLGQLILFNFYLTFSDFNQQLLFMTFFLLFNLCVLYHNFFSFAFIIFSLLQCFHLLSLFEVL